MNNSTTGFVGSVWKDIGHWYPLRDIFTGFKDPATVPMIVHVITKRTLDASERE
jgi:hypothetical protein